MRMAQRRSRLGSIRAESSKAPGTLSEVYRMSGGGLFGQGATSQKALPSADPRPPKIHETEVSISDNFMPESFSPRQEGSAARTPNTNATRLQAGSVKRGASSRMVCTASSRKPPKPL